MFEQFKTYLSQFIVISQRDWQIIEQKLKFITFSKNEMVTNHGQIESKLYFLQSGLMRLYYEAENKEITLNIAFPNSFVCAYSSFLKQEPSHVNLACLSHCEAVCLNKSDLLGLYQQTECGQALGRIFAENLFLYLSNREDAFLIKSPTQRYLDLFEEQPQLIREIPLKYLASYIGITPQALSRIRAKL